MREYVAAVVVALLLIASTAPLTSAQVFGWSRTTWVLIPAVYGDQGVVVNVSVTLAYPGSGQVTVTDNSGSVGSSTLYSMEMAFMVAMLYAGLNWGNYELSVHINASGNIEGPSGSFAVMLATFALATGLNASALHMYAVTGAVSPSGLSGPIGGLQYKCEAASSGRLGIVFPVGNEMTANESCNSTDKVPVAGLFQALHDVFGSYGFSSNVTVSAPPMFDQVMMNVASYFVNRTDEILSSITGEISALPWASLGPGVEGSVTPTLEEMINGSETDLGLASQYMKRLPYAAASLAFTAYVDALAANYTVWALGVAARGGNPASLIDGQATSVYSSAESMISSAQAYANRSYALTFSELMATAFARLADALYYSSYAQGVAGGSNLSAVYVPAFYLAMAKARLLSAVGWLMEANASINEGPNVTAQLLASTATALGQFTDVGVKYADSLIQYYVQQLIAEGDQADAQVLQSMESDLNFLVSEADGLLSQGYYLAAIGVYEDALTNALNVIFVETRSFSSPAVTSSYAQELQTEYTTLALDLAKRGLISSLDSAYMGYASALMPKDPQDAINIMEAAVIDELAWYLGSLSYGQTQPQIVQQLASGGYSFIGTVAVAVAAVAAGALLATALALNSYRKALRALGPS